MKSNNLCPRKNSGESQMPRCMHGTVFLPNIQGRESCDKQTDGICFSVTVGALVLITNARRYTIMAKASSKLLPQLWFLFFPPFSLPFFFLYAPGVNKWEGPVARKTTLYMKPFMPSRFPVFVHEEFLSEGPILQSPLNISLRVPVIFGAADMSSYWKDRSKEQELHHPSLWSNANH